MKNIIPFLISIIILLTFSAESGAQSLSPVTKLGGLEPPTNLQATVSGANVHLNWDAPSGAGGIEEELIYDNNTVSSSYKYPGVVMSTRMSPSDTCQILTIKYYTTREGGDDQFNARIYNWEGTQPGTTLLHNTLQTAVNDDWVEIDVSSGNIQVTGDFVVGFGSFTEQAFLGYDENLNNGRSWDYNESTQAWGTWHQAYLIRAVVLYQSGKIETLGTKLPETVNLIKENKKRSESKNNSRQAQPISNQFDRLLGLQGYAVYRDGIEITANPIPYTYYDDDLLGQGTYSYTVKAVYDEGNSEPAGPVEATVSGNPLLPPTKLDGYTIDDQIRLWWVSPEGGTEEELIYDNNQNTSAYIFSGITMSTQMSPQDECELIKLKYFTSLEGSDVQFYARVFNWTGSQPGTNMLLNRSEQAANNTWVEVDVEGSGLYFTGDFVVGFGSVSEEAFLAFDGDNNNGRSWDFNENTQEWTSWDEIYLIRAIVRYGDGTLAEIGGINSVFQGYNMYRNGDKINTSIIPTTSYTDYLPDFGDYNYNVTAVYDDGESAFSLTSSFSYHLSISEFDELGVKIYPNPARDKLNLKTQEEIISVHLFNVLGAEVYHSRDLSGDHIIRLDKLTKGIYVMRVETERGIASTKIVVE